MLRNITRALKQSGPKIYLLSNSPRGPRPVLQLAHGLLFEFPDQIATGECHRLLAGSIVMCGRLKLVHIVTEGWSHDEGRVEEV